MSKPTLCVIVPVYKAAATLDRCVASVLAQQVAGGLHCILVDDGSPDESGGLCDAWAAKDPRVTVLHQENRGVSAARNAGIDAAKGRYYSFIDSDDVVLPGFLQTLYDACERHDAYMALCSVEDVQENGKSCDPAYFTRPTQEGVFCGKDLLNDFYAIKRSIDTISQGIEARVRICINQLLYTPKHTARLLQVLKKQFPTCQITVTTEVYNGVWDAIINNQANIAIGAPDTLLDGGGIDYTEIGAIRWAFAIAPDHPLAFVPEPIAESQLRLYPNIMVEDTAHTINRKVGWLLHGKESILVPDFNTKCQCQILGEGIGFLPDYMVREAMAQSLLVTRQIHNPRQDSRMLLATQHSATGQVTQWIKKQFAPNGILTGIYQDLLHREN